MLEMEGILRIRNRAERCLFIPLLALAAVTTDAAETVVDFSGDHVQRPPDVALDGLANAVRSRHRAPGRTQIDSQIEHPVAPLLWRGFGHRSTFEMVGLAQAAGVDLDALDDGLGEVLAIDRCHE